MVFNATFSNISWQTVLLVEETGVAALVAPSADSKFVSDFRQVGFSCYPNRQTSGESASLPQYLGCYTVFDMRLRVTFLRRKTVLLQSNIAHRE
jgi:hypothetical protein